MDEVAQHIDSTSRAASHWLQQVRDRQEAGDLDSSTVADLARAVADLGIGSLSARRLDGHWKAGVAGDAWLRLRLHDQPAVETRPFLVLLETLPLGE